VQAADELFRERGYAGTTMKGIAERAGVARDTVHAVFGNKAQLIPAIIDLRLVPDESVLNVADTPAGQAVRNEPDPTRQVELFADFITKLNIVLRPVFDLMRSAALSVREGMSRQKALEALTIAGAKMLDLGTKIGSLEKGKDADFVILSGDPFSVYTHVEQTWVEGLKRFDRSNPADKAFAVGGYKIYTPENGEEDDDHNEWNDTK